MANPAATPVFTPAGGTIPAGQKVSITDATKGAVIYSATNGTTPATSSTKYTGAITLSVSETMDAVAVAAGYRNSKVASEKYGSQRHFRWSNKQAVRTLRRKM